MKKTLFTVVLLTIFITVSADAQSTARTTRYWDSCKPSCGWTANATQSPNGTCTSCNVSGTKLSGYGDRNACESAGTAYTCMGQAPWAVDDNLAYGFTATHRNSDCGKCFELTFTSNGEGGNSASIIGKKMVVMASNIGGDVDGNQFDLMIPGGGVGLYNALSNQISQNGGPGNPSLGNQYGGFRATCGNNATCVRNMCDAAFNTPALADLKRGCYWYVDWFKITNNPNVTFVDKDCPTDLVTAYRDGKGGGSDGPVTPVTYTVAYNANGGTGNAPATQTVNAGSNVTLASGSGLTRTGYTFAGWNTNAQGTGTNHNAGASFTPNANTTMYARWTQNQATTYTVTYNANGGTGTAPATQTVNAGSSVTLASGSGLTRTGYTFAGWNTSANGQGANHNAGANFTPTANTTMYARWTQNQATTYTVTYNANGGTGTAPSAQTVNAGSSVTLASGSGLTRTGFTFGGWNTNAGGSGTNYNAGASFTPTANVTLYARWIAATATTYTLTINAGTGGTVNPSGQQTVEEGAAFNISASANSGYSFTSWTVTAGGAQIANVNNPATTVTLTANATITANFQQQQQGGGARTDTIKVEAETLMPHLPNCDPNQSSNPMCIGTNSDGVTNIGWINDGDNATYTINVTNLAKNGVYTLEIRLASEQDISFSLSINGSNIGNVARSGTGGWDTYITQRFSSDVTLREGENTIVFSFYRAVNIDYFLLIGEPVPVSVRHGAVSANKTARASTVKLKSAAGGGFSATLSPNHNYTSYKLINLQGREVRSGQVGHGTTELRFDNLKNSVFFLKLEGRNGASAVVRAVTY
ncbi:MAG: InlB B-repeat-containing protein [Chitinispirillia bacterium]|nr:InlB B-repeat-containing protein [Chitinispirillia bacterium]MCL2269454.1 InlB B-repeat-containing protein [Chitinispirillia bacterium]